MMQGLNLLLMIHVLNLLLQEQQELLVETFMLPHTCQ
jgi:hypothetical protein